MSDDRPEAQQPDVSVVVPTHNRPEHLRACLGALLAQNHPSYEVIVVDDASDAPTRELLDGLDSEHDQLRVLRNDANRGANFSRNRAIEAAAAPIIACTDDDCTPDPDWLANLTAPLTDAAVGVVTGLVVDTEPRTIYDRAYLGTHRIDPGNGQQAPAHRIIGCNLAVRADLLKAHGFDKRFSTTAITADGKVDTAISARSDEEGLYLRLRAAGHRVVANPAARVTHDHHYTRASFYRQARRSGRAAANLVHAYALDHRTDLLPLLLAYLTLPPALVAALTGSPTLLLLPAVLFALALASWVYNDLARKRKTPADTLATLHVLIAYYHVRAVGYLARLLQLALTAPRDAPDRVR